MTAEPVLLLLFWPEFASLIGVEDIVIVDDDDDADVGGWGAGPFVSLDIVVIDVVPVSSVAFWDQNF